MTKGTGSALHDLQAHLTVTLSLSLNQNPAPQNLQTIDVFFAIPRQSYVTLTTKQIREDFVHA
jgi:hypothetical protein